MQRVLLTGFEPFGGDSINPSALIAERLHGLTIKAGSRSAKITGLVLPCAFDAAVRNLYQALDDLQPMIVLCTGLAAGREDLSFERVAVNLMDARIADNEGYQPMDQRVLRTRRDAYFATLPVKAMAQAALEEGVEASLSLSAGTYVCNAVFFALMHRMAKPGAQSKRKGKVKPMRGGFMHMPLLPEQAKHDPKLATMPLAMIALGVQAALVAALAHDIDVALVGGEVA